MAQRVLVNYDYSCTLFAILCSVNVVLADGFTRKNLIHNFPSHWRCTFHSAPSWPARSINTELYTQREDDHRGLYFLDDRKTIVLKSSFWWQCVLILFLGQYDQGYKLKSARAQFRLSTALLKLRVNSSYF